MCQLGAEQSRTECPPLFRRRFSPSPCHVHGRKPQVSTEVLLAHWPHPQTGRCWRVPFEPVGCKGGNPSRSLKNCVELQRCDTQRAQYPLIKEYALNHDIKAPYTLRSIVNLRGTGLSGCCPECLQTLQQRLLRRLPLNEKGHLDRVPCGSLGLGFRV